MMKKILEISLIWLGVLLMTWGSLGLGNRAWAQGASRELSDQQRREMEQRYQEDWETRERLNQRQRETGKRVQDARQRRQDAQQRQREAQRKMQELEQQRQSK